MYIYIYIYIYILRTCCRAACTTRAWVAGRRMSFRSVGQRVDLDTYGNTRSRKHHNIIDLEPIPA